MITLTLLASGSVQQQWRFEQQQTIRIGRADDNDLMINDQQVSRHHLDLLPSNPGSAQGVWQLQSHGTNGTLLNGQWVTQGVVAHGSTIQLGLAGPTLRFEIQIPETSLPLNTVNTTSQEPLRPTDLGNCTHEHNQPDNRFCIFCGAPLHD